MGNRNVYINKSILTFCAGLQGGTTVARRSPTVENIRDLSEIAKVLPVDTSRVTMWSLEEGTSHSHGADSTSQLAPSGYERMILCFPLSQFLTV